jgi:DnaJ-class molecular chaperone
MTIVIRKQCEECEGEGYLEPRPGFNKLVPCPICDGRGSVEHDEPEEDEALCNECGGLLVGATS